MEEELGEAARWKVELRVMGKGEEKGGRETAVLLDFLQITRVPLTSPICLDYPDGSGEPRDLKRPRPLFLSSLPSSPRPFSFPLTRRNGLDGSQIDIC